MSRTPTVRSSLLGIAADAPPNPYAFPRTYIVRNGRADGRLDLDPPTDVAHLKPLAGVAVWGPAGYSAEALPGDRVLVVFRDADPRGAVVVAFEPLPTGRHPRVSIDGTAVQLGGADAPAAREGGTYTLGSAAGVLTFVPGSGAFLVPSRVKV